MGLGGFYLTKLNRKSGGDEFELGEDPKINGEEASICPSFLKLLGARIPNPGSKSGGGK